MQKRITKLNSAKKRQIAEYYVDNNSTVRDTAKHFCVSKSCVHHALVDYQHNKATASTPLALKVKEQCNKNISERATRGGQVTKAKYSKK